MAEIFLKIQFKISQLSCKIKLSRCYFMLNGQFCFKGDVNSIVVKRKLFFFQLPLCSILFVAHFVVCAPNSNFSKRLYTYGVVVFSVGWASHISHYLSFKKKIPFYQKFILEKIFWPIIILALSHLSVCQAYTYLNSPHRIHIVLFRFITLIHVNLQFLDPITFNLNIKLLWQPITERILARINSVFIYFCHYIASIKMDKNSLYCTESQQNLKQSKELFSKVFFTASPISNFLFTFIMLLLLYR